jgi:hypothetical protein
VKEYSQTPTEVNRSFKMNIAKAKGFRYRTALTSSKKKRKKKSKLKIKIKKKKKENEKRCKFDPVVNVSGFVPNWTCGVIVIILGKVDHTWLSSTRRVAPRRTNRR